MDDNKSNSAIIYQTTTSSLQIWMITNYIFFDAQQICPSSSVNLVEMEYIGSRLDC